MLVKSIRIENFQQHQKVFELNVSSGLNIIYGNNEAGKSTLLRALRAILFDRFNGKAGEDYAGYRGGSPEVSIKFEFQGRGYTLEKIFSKKKDGRAVLMDSAGQQWIGTEAEAQLANLLKFESVERGLAKSEQQGIYGVLWVEQGKAWEQVKISDNASACQTIQNVLSHELTNMLSQGKGEALLQTFSADLKQYQTEKTAKPTGEFKEKIEKMEDEKNKLSQLDEELKNYQTKVDELDDCQQQLAQFTVNNIEQEDKLKLEDAEKRLQYVEKLNQQYKDAQQNLELMQTKYESAKIKDQARASLIESLEREKSLLESNQSRVDGMQIELTQYQKDFQTAQNDLSETKNHYTDVSLTLDKARDYQKVMSLQTKIIKTNEQLGKIKELQKELAAQQENLAQICIDDSGLNNLKSINKQIDTVKVKLDSIATRLQFTIENHDNVFLGSESLVGNGEKLLTEVTELIFGKNKIVILPGGQELNTLRVQLEDATEQLTTLLAKYRITSIEEADMQVSHKAALKAEIKSLQEQMNIIAPAGIDQLTESLSNSKGEEKSLQAKIGEEQFCSVVEAETAALEAQNEYEKSQRNERAEHDKLIAKQEEFKQAKAQFFQVEQTVKMQLQKLEQDRKTAADDVLRNQAYLLKSEAEEADKMLNKLKAELQDVDAEGAKLEVDRRRNALQSTQQKINKIKLRIHDLEVELRVSGHRGLAEEKEQAEQKLKEGTLAVNRLRGHVGSLNLLCNIIKEEIQTAKELVVKPLTEAMKPYLRILFPDSEPIIDENFCLQHILRNGVREAFENLSLGTREQMAILIRLAYAELLAERGTPTLLILDDALVNTDDNRREKMKQILYRASQKFQIILLTCHGNVYRDSGGTMCEISG